MKSTAKSIAAMRDLKDKLAILVDGSATIDTIAESFDTNGFPVMLLSDGGTVTASEPVIFIRMRAVDAVCKDIFGNDTYAYTPHVIDVAYELDGTVPEPTQLDLLMVFAEVVKLGARIAITEIADGTQVTVANVDTGPITKELSADLINPMKGM